MVWRWRAWCDRGDRSAQSMVRVLAPINRSECASSAGLSQITGNLVYALTIVVSAVTDALRSHSVDAAWGNFAYRRADVGRVAQMGLSLRKRPSFMWAWCSQVREVLFTLSRSQSANLEESTGHIISTPFKIVLMAHTHLVEMRTRGKGTTTAPDVVDAIFGIDKMNVFGTSTSAANACLQTITEAQATCCPLKQQNWTRVQDGYRNHTD